MMVLSHKCSCGPCITLLRNICMNAVLECNHYKVLGLNPTATHAEIKSAYYELSKKHHPDKNQGSEKSAKMFRDIAEAYEILGNEKSRKQYDREQLYMRKSESYAFGARTKQDYNDDLERMYYERRMGRKYYGKTYYYDFDAWYKAHYGKSKYYTYQHTHSSQNKRYQYDRSKVNSDINSFHKTVKVRAISHFIIIFLISVWVLTYNKAFRS